MLSKEEQSYLLSLARKSIEHHLSDGELLKLNVKMVPETLKVKKGCFVTLKVGDMLRGCIGHLLPVQELYKDVIENAVNAGFQDPRFPSMVKKELEDVHVEISVLDIPKELKYKDGDDLLVKLKTKPGVILKKGFHQATFLPQVWEELEKAEEFLGHLCMKAGLPPDTWRKDKLDIEEYGVEKFEE